MHLWEPGPEKGLVPALVQRERQKGLHHIQVLLTQLETAWCSWCKHCELQCTPAAGLQASSHSHQSIASRTMAAI